MGPSGVIGVVVAIHRERSATRLVVLEAVTELEPSLEGRFRDGLFYADEGHVEPRRVLPELHARFTAAGGTIQFASEANPDEAPSVVTIATPTNRQDIRVTDESLTTIPESARVTKPRPQAAPAPP